MLVLVGNRGGSEDGERQELSPACPHVLPLQAGGWPRLCCQLHPAGLCPGPPLGSAPGGSRGTGTGTGDGDEDGHGCPEPAPAGVL